MIKHIALSVGLFALGLSAFGAEPQTADPASPQEDAPATEEPAQSITAQRPPVQSDALEQLMSAYPRAQLLDAGAEKFFSLYTPDQSGKAQGAVLIIQRGEQPPWWGKQLEHLRTHLPDYGWATLLILLPTEEPSIPPREMPLTDSQNEEADTGAGDDSNAAPKIAEEGEDKEMFDSESGELASTEQMNQLQQTPNTSAPEQPIAERSRQRLLAALHFLQSQGQYNLALLSDSTSAPLAVETLRQTIPSTADTAPLAAQILLTRARDLPQGEEDSEQSLLSPLTPTLDIYIDLDEPVALNRKRVARKQQLQIFQQLRISRYDEERLSRRVRGFLLKHAEGMEVEAK